MRLLQIVCLNLIIIFQANSLLAQIKKNDPVYVQTVSNESKTIDFVIGVYPKTFHWSKTLNATTVTLRVLNRGNMDYVWNDYKIYIFLRDKTILYNYTHENKEGEYACFYTVKKEGGVNDQTLILRKKFRLSHIKSVWVAFADNNFIELLYSDGE